MENHPIPQDVTGFQFKLIGNMTVKQFAYLATGIVFAWILYQLPVNILLKFPFCAISAIAGTMLAYVPIAGRPIDVMIGNYIKALIRPTQFIYEKSGGQIYIPSNMPALTVKKTKQYGNTFSPLPKDKLKEYLETLETKPSSGIDEKENNYLMSISSLAAAPQISPQPNLASYADFPKVAVNIEPIIRIGVPEQKIEPPQPAETVMPAPAITAVAPEKITNTTPTAPTGFNRVVSMPTMPDFPNLITGIVKDPRGNALPGILVEIKDKDGNPVRAFKTNGFGKFASATPLTNGDYVVVFEDPKSQNRFEAVTINISGQIVPPLEAVSIDTREELRRSLFAQAN